MQNETVSRGDYIDVGLLHNSGPWEDSSGMVTAALNNFFGKTRPMHVAYVSRLQDATFTVIITLAFGFVSEKSSSLPSAIVNTTYIFAKRKPTDRSLQSRKC